MDANKWEEMVSGFFSYPRQKINKGQVSNIDNTSFNEVLIKEREKERGRDFSFARTLTSLGFGFKPKSKEKRDWYSYALAQRSERKLFMSLLHNLTVELLQNEHERRKDKSKKNSRLTNIKRGM